MPDKPTGNTKRKLLGDLHALDVMKDVVEEQRQITLAQLNGRTPPVSQLSNEGDPCESKVDPNAPPTVRLCQMAALALCLIVDWDRQTYCDHHDECTPT